MIWWSVSNHSHNWFKISFVCFCPNSHRFSRRKVDTDCLKCRMFQLFSAIQFLFLTPLQWRYLASCHSACHSPPCSDILDIKSSRKMLELLYKGFVNSSSDSHLFIIWLFSKSFCKYLQGMTQTNLFKYFKSFAVQQIKTKKRLNGNGRTDDHKLAFLELLSEPYSEEMPKKTSTNV